MKTANDKQIVSPGSSPAALQRRHAGLLVLTTLLLDGLAVPTAAERLQRGASPRRWASPPPRELPPRSY